MIPRILTISIIFLTIALRGVGRPADIDSLIMVLDQAISDRDMCRQEHEAYIAQLRTAYMKADNDTDRFHRLGDLHDAYFSYDTDSALALCKRREELARRIGDHDLIIHSKLTTANTLCAIGLQIETLAIMDSIDYNEVPQYLRLYYNHIYRTTYGLMTDFAVRKEDRDKYFAITDAYRDSLLNWHEEGSLYRAIIVCDHYNVHGQPQQGIDFLKAYFDKSAEQPHEVAIASYTLSESYRLLGDTDNQMRQLIISAIGDMTSAVKEYVSLRKLAIILYQQGDLKHAYEYLRVCMEDAMDCKARLRMLEINNIANVVNDVYLDTIEHQQSRLRWSLLWVCLLSALLLGALYWINREMRKLARARRDVTEANGQLKQLNQELRQANAQLKEANHIIAENSSLKEEYIAQYMDQCSVYIEKLDRYRKGLSKVVKSGSIDELKKYDKSLGQIDDEIKSFYDSFDETFLKLFPTFVEDLNALLQPGEELVPKSPGKLNTELRIFALIRLGIDDSAKIAQFLRYSVTTIYNYRTRVRNKARGDRDELETQIMTIGRAE
ncbi:MAG: DUF6377 domain-containing protein [Bacteroidales bacterium]|nr:DUF6377 domain-containing protein [Bacteroidales bacterium]